MNQTIASFLGALGTLKYYALVESKYRFLSHFGNLSGVTTKKRSPSIVVSLTTFPARFDKAFLCVESLLRQSLKPDHLVLWVAETDGTIPATLTKLEARGLQIRRCKDIRSYKKIIYALKEFPECAIVTADDDFFYPRHWLRDLYAAYLAEPQIIHCHRAHLATGGCDGMPAPYKEWSYGAPGVVGPSQLLFPTSGAGVLYPPHCFDEDVCNEELFLSLCPLADDVWLKAMLLKRGIACKKVSLLSPEFIQVKGTQEMALWRENVVQGKNDEQIRAVFKRFHLTL
jgi:hypothetical protein